MTSWWEVAVPAAAALGGAGLGSWWQFLAENRMFTRTEKATEHIRQLSAKREDERRYIDVRHAQYVVVGINVREVIDAIEHEQVLADGSYRLDADGQEALRFVRVQLASVRTKLRLSVEEALFLVSPAIAATLETLLIVAQGSDTAAITNALAGFRALARNDVRGEEQSGLAQT